VLGDFCDIFLYEQGAIGAMNHGALANLSFECWKLVGALGTLVNLRPTGFSCNIVLTAGVCARVALDLGPGLTPASLILDGLHL
jgi:hypothetical protein